ncbi:MAG: hypothetical protein SFV54_25055 [Bryobacteraceae bacterium]|nr:hypothetical protein [Bryobacteraceae bacterium]
MDPRPYSPNDVTRSHAWLNHNRGYTEVTILHPLFKPQEQDWNRAHHAWPITRYVRSNADLLHFVRTYAGERMLCFGINPRPSPLRYENGGLRSAKEADITVSQTLLLDIDLEGTITTDRLEHLRRFLRRADEYFTSKGLHRPIRARTGRGSHLLLAYEAISVVQHPTISDQLRTFKEDFRQANRVDLHRLEARIDSTQDLRRMVRVYGTAKPRINVISRFYGPYQRHNDPALREYLLRLPPTPRKAIDPLPNITIAAKLPQWFEDRLKTDTILYDLWHGRGKPPGTDQSNSGYDYTIARHLASIEDVSTADIATIIAVRPTGAGERASKGVAYLRRTIMAALNTINKGTRTQNTDY